MLDPRHPPAAIPAEAGIQRLERHAWIKPWAPSVAGTAYRSFMAIPPNPQSRIPNYCATNCTPLPRKAAITAP